MTGERPAGALPPETLAAIRVVFFEECEAHLAQLTAGLRALQAGRRDPEAIGDAARAAHSIKGGAGIFQLNALARFSGRLETALGEIRAGRLEPGPDILGLLSRACEALADLVAAGAEDRPADPALTAPILEQLAAVASEPAAPAGLDFTPRPMPFQPLRRA
ncbi:MAG TPA: Hpt domain-containing protein [Caulobacteraceae bacterium]|jgi:two-component system chemotaxis sensor kinase CheA|nr:Hpt domain-containing protein [Caulobacteraceae bacterium]